MSKPVLAVISDWMFCNSGFGNVAKGILTRLKDKYDIHQLSINYSGDYHKEQSNYKFYHVGDHIYGFNKIEYFLNRAKPDLLFIIQDPFIADKMITRVRAHSPNLPCVLYCPVDSPNVPRKYVNLLNQFNQVVTYTNFGRNELHRSGLLAPCSVIPHGVNTETFYPVDKKEAREALDLPQDVFFVGYTAVNQPRKKIDVWIYILNEWLKRYPHEDVRIYYHGQVVRKGGLDIPQYLEYLDGLNAELGASHRLKDIFFTTSDNPLYQIDEDAMRYIYSSFDVYFHACANAGWEMPVHESLACKVPTICADYSALSEWPIDEKGPGVFYVPVSETPDAVTSGANTIQRTVDIYWSIQALENLYNSHSLRTELGNRGYAVATQDRFNWSNIAGGFDTIFTKLLEENK